jgi:protein TonB
MSNVSIYEKNWTELVFEDKNKAYGAYQLRQENPRTTVLAFFVGTSFILALIGSWFLLSSFSTHTEDGIADDPIAPKIVTVDLSQRPPAEPLGSKAPVAPNQSPLEPTNLSHMVVAATPDAHVDIPTNADLKTTSTDTGDATGPAVDAPINIGSPAGTALTPAVDTKAKSPAELDRLPEYPGGMKKFYEFVMNNVEESKFENSSGTVSVIMGFVIEKDGSMTDIRVLRSSDKSLEKEAIRVLKSLKVKWSPGWLDGDKVRTQYTLPIKVDLKN